MSVPRFTSASSTASQPTVTPTAGLANLEEFRKRREEHKKQGEGLLVVSGDDTVKRRAEEVHGADDHLNNKVGREEKEDKAKDKQKKRGPKKKRKVAKAKLSFGDDEDNVDDDNNAQQQSLGDSVPPNKKKPKTTANSAVPPPKILTKSQLAKDATLEAQLRSEFLTLQARLKATRLVIPFVFYDGSDIPGGTVTVRKGDAMWVFLDRCRKVGADMDVGEGRKGWARVGVDDLLVVRGGVILPHHYEFWWFGVGKVRGPGGEVLFEFKKGVEDLKREAEEENKRRAGEGKVDDQDLGDIDGIDTAPSYTKVVNRRWYDRNKHIYPASTWREFDPEVDYTKDIKRDTGGNAFFYS